MHEIADDFTHEILMLGFGMSADVDAARRHAVSSLRTGSPVLREHP